MVSVQVLATPAAAAPVIDMRELVLAGLRRRPKRVPSSYFYDDEGSRLFRLIMQLPGYYLSRAEHEILTTAAPRLAGTFAGQSVVVADLGAGDGSKTRVLLHALAGGCRDLCYAPIDISLGALDELERQQGPELSNVRLEPLVSTFEAGLREVGRRYPGHTRLGLLLGSNIGNFTQSEALGLLVDLHRSLGRGDYLLIGFDLLKDPARLQRAYDDDDGVTAAFNLNLLTRMNRELGADFDVGAFRHYARYDPGKQAMESFLLSTRDQLVRIGPECIGFSAWEALQTEISCKYRETDVLYLARNSGFVPVGWYYDGERRFLDVLLRADSSIR
jgi:dimethylhistidine N-methyltransferase